MEFTKATIDGTYRNLYVIKLFNGHRVFHLNRDGSITERYGVEDRENKPNIEIKTYREAIQLLKNYYKTGPGKILSPQYHQDRYMEFEILEQKK